MRGTSAVFVKPCLLLALLVGGPGPAENAMMPTLVSPSCCALMPLHLDACHSCAMREVGIDDDGSDFSEGYLHKRYRAYHAQVDGRIPPQRNFRYGLNELGGEECSLCGPDGVYKGSVPDPDCHGEDGHFRMNKVRRICDGWNMGNAPAVHGFGEACTQGSISTGTASGQVDDHSLLREMLKDVLPGLDGRSVVKQLRTC